MIDRSHRLGPVRGENNPKPRPVILKFCSYRFRKAVFTTKRKLKESGVSVTESLTKQRMKLLNEAQKVVSEGNSWTVNSFIFVKQGRRIIKGKVHPKNMLFSDVRSDKIGKNAIDRFSISPLVLKIFAFKVEKLVICRQPS